MCRHLESMCLVNHWRYLRSKYVPSNQLIYFSRWLVNIQKYTYDIQYTYLVWFNHHSPSHFCLMENCWCFASVRGDEGYRALYKGDPDLELPLFQETSILWIFMEMLFTLMYISLFLFFWHIYIYWDIIGYRLFLYRNSKFESCFLGWTMDQHWFYSHFFGNMMVHYKIIDIMATFGWTLRYMILIVAAPCKWEKTPNPQWPATHHFLGVVQP